MSICTPVRNSERCLPDYIRSLKAQTLQPLEYIICIGKSQDNTEQLVKDFQSNSITPVKILYDNEGIGTGYARKLLVEEAKGDYVVWVDSDYLLSPNWLETILSLITTHNVDTIQADMTHITHTQALEMRKNNFLPPTIDLSHLKITKSERNDQILKRETVLKAGNYDPFFTRGQDMDLVIRLTALGAKRVKCKGLTFYHTGLLQQYSKMFDFSVFFKFFYKYGPKYLTLGGEHREHTLAFLLRSSIVFSSLWLILSLLLHLPITLPLLFLLFPLFLLFVGETQRFGFKPNLYLIQLGKCFGEYLTLYRILKNKNKEPLFYGRRFLNSTKIKILITGNDDDVLFMSTLLSPYPQFEVSTIVFHTLDKFFEALRKLKGTKIVHINSIETNDWEGVFWFFILFTLQTLRKKIILLWTGTDVLHLKNSRAKIFSKLLSRQIAVSPWLCKELKTKGINATYMPSILLQDIYNSPLPTDFTVLTYLGHRTRNEFYGKAIVEKLIQDFPDVKFLILGEVDETERLNFPNVEYFGKVKRSEIDSFYYRSTVLLRVIKHDGLSAMVLEALARGRYVIWSQEFPYCLYATTYSEAYGSLSKLRKVKIPNSDGSHYVKEHFNSTLLSRQLVKIYENVLRRKI